MMAWEVVTYIEPIYVEPWFEGTSLAQHTDLNNSKYVGLPPVPQLGSGIQAVGSVS